MNYGISLLFRAIPLAMALFCFAYGACITLSGDDPSRLAAGPVIFFLGSVCVAFYAAADTLVRQIIGTFTTSARYILPTVGYALALLTLVCGLFVIHSGEAGAYVAGHAICGLGLITAGAATAATSSSRAALILHAPAGTAANAHAAGFSTIQAATLTAIAAAIAAGAWLWTMLLFASSTTERMVAGSMAEHTAAGSFMLGMACICTSLVAPAACFARQSHGRSTRRERAAWSILSIGMGAAAFVAGIIMLIVRRGEWSGTAGYILIGLALICWSIAGTVLLLAKPFDKPGHAESAHASHLQIIPVAAALCALLLTAFLFEGSLHHVKLLVPARLLTGFGAVCFALYPIAAILEREQKTV